ncbi:MAG: MFS transporter, partial [Pseudomonadota bacterium]
MPDVNRRAIAAGAVGNALEWYDFAVFGFFAPVISTQFFPADDHLAGLINTFGVFAAGYLMRPIGGFLFGHLGDRLGRRRALLVSIIAMAVPTSLMAEQKPADRAHEIACGKDAERIDQ